MLESIIIPIFKKFEKKECSNYRGEPYFSVTYKLLFNIMTSNSCPYAEKVIGNHDCGFRRNSPTNDLTFYIC
jgi:hypothetical protein